MKTKKIFQKLIVIFTTSFMFGNTIKAQDAFYYFQDHKILLKKIEADSISKVIRSAPNNSAKISNIEIYEYEGSYIAFGNQFAVKPKDTVSESSIQYLIQKYGCDTLRLAPYTDRQYYISVGNSLYSSVELANLFYETGLFEFSEPDILYLNALQTADPHWNKQWGLKNSGQDGGTATIDINVEDAWNVLKNEESAIKVAVVDQGVKSTHPDLKSNLLPGYSLELGTKGSARNGDTHGTCCAGIIAAEKNNNVGICGVAPECKIIPINAWGRDFGSVYYFPASYLAQGIRWAYKTGKADIISNSWGESAPNSDITNAIHDAVTKGRDGKGCVVIFASGNGNKTKVCESTSKMADVLVVGAIDRCGFRSGAANVTQSCDPWNVKGSGSNYGQKLGVVAPGSSVYTTSNEGYEMFGGTSAACPHVSGVAALILAVNPNLTYQEVYAIIQKTARKLPNYQFSNDNSHPYGSWNEEVGYGLVDAYAATMAACGDRIIENETISTTKNIKNCGNVVIKDVNVSPSGKLKVETSGSVEIYESFELEEGAELEITIQ